MLLFPKIDGSRSFAFWHGNADQTHDSALNVCDFLRVPDHRDWRPRLCHVLRHRSSEPARCQARHLRHCHRARSVLHARNLAGRQHRVRASLTAATSMLPVNAGAGVATERRQRRAAWCEGGRCAWRELLSSCRAHRMGEVEWGGWPAEPRSSQSHAGATRGEGQVCLQAPASRSMRIRTEVASFVRATKHFLCACTKRACSECAPALGLACVARRVQA